MVPTAIRQDLDELPLFRPENHAVTFFPLAPYGHFETRAFSSHPQKSSPRSDPICPTLAIKCPFGAGFLAGIGSSWCLFGQGRI